MPEHTPKKPLGIYIEHRFRKATWLYMVMVWKKPYLDPNGRRMSRFCPLCQTLHFTKTYHLDLQDGRAIVSKGALDDLRLAGLPDLDIVGTTKHPPPLRIGRNATSRPAQNMDNRQILVWKSYKPKGVLTDAFS